MESRRILRKNEGGALVTVMLMATVASAVMISYMINSAQSARLARRAIDYQKAQIAAEAALEYGVMQLKETLFENQLTLTQSQIQGILDTMSPPPPVGDYQFLTPSGLSAYDIHADTAVIVGVITNGSACLGSDGEYEVFTITAGARNPGAGVGAVLQQQLQGVGLFLVRYAIFYDEDLEINPGAPMTISGPVHVNANLYMAPDDSSLHCADRITAVGDMYRRRKDSSGNIGSVGIDNESGVEKLMTIDSDTPNWMIESIRLWEGRVLSKAHGVQYLSPPIEPLDVPHDLIERRPEQEP